MTSQTKHYIEISDVVAVRGECSRCGATVSIPITVRPLRLEGLRNCPSCNEPWAQYGTSSIESMIQKFVEQFIELQDTLKRLRDLVIDHQGRSFLLTLEIKGEAVAPTASASGRASGARGD